MGQEELIFFAEKRQSRKNGCCRATSETKFDKNLNICLIFFGHTVRSMSSRVACRCKTFWIAHERWLLDTSHAHINCCTYVGTTNNAVTKRKFRGKSFWMCSSYVFRWVESGKKLLLSKIVKENWSFKGLRGSFIFFLVVYHSPCETGTIFCPSDLDVHVGENLNSVAHQDLYNGTCALSRIGQHCTRSCWCLHMTFTICNKRSFIIFNCKM